MAVKEFTVDGIRVTVEESVFRERVYFDGERMSEISTLRPVLSRVHAFETASPPARFELRSYGIGGWVLIRDGRLLASQRPGWGLAAFFALLGVLNWLDFGFDRGRTDLVMAALWTLAAAFGFMPYWSWERITRRWPHVDRGGDAAIEVK